MPNDRVLVAVGVERQYALLTGRWGALVTAPALLPGVFTSGNRRLTAQSCGGGTALDLCYVGRSYGAWGIGLLPLSLRVQSSAAHRVSVAAHAAGGGVWFARAIPVPAGTRFNFLAQGGADLGVRATRRSWLVVGYRHVHVSNGGRGDANPGIDAPLLALGGAWR